MDYWGGKKRSDLQNPYGGHTYMFSLGWIRGIFRTWKLFWTICEEKDAMIYGSVLLSLRYIAHPTLNWQTVRQPLALSLTLPFSLLFILVGLLVVTWILSIFVSVGLLVVTFALDSGEASRLHELYKKFPNRTPEQVSATASENVCFYVGALCLFLWVV